MTERELSPAADQKKRLKEIWVQLTANRVILDEEIQKELVITAEQKAKIKALQDKQQEAMQAIMEKMRNQEIEREEAQATIKKNDEALSVELGKLLTADQAAKIKAMQGKAFKADKQDGGG